MKKLIVLTAVAVVALASPAWAGQCPKLAKQIQDASGNRFDATAADAKVKVVQVQKLHGEGKHADSEKLAKETLTKLGVKM